MNKEFNTNLKEKAQNFDYVSIAIASPEIIRSWSKGEVKNPETINYRTFNPEPGGLFCQRIFGPVRDYECACGKYKRIKYKGITCDRCGVEITISRVRRERMGHIELSVPVTHIWFLKSMPSRLGLLLDLTTKSLEKVVYYESYMITDPGKTPFEVKNLLNESEYIRAQREYGENSFIAKIGAEALKDILMKINLEQSLKEIKENINSTRSKQIKKKLSKRLKVINGFIKSKTRPEWMILEVLPVIPPDLRPLVPLEGGRFATSDLNDLYRRVINRNKRLMNLLQLKTPDVIIYNEKRMLQEAIDALFDNGKHGKSITTAGNRPLKSLSDMLKGKQGRFRQNLLGKRVDYSGRSVIVIGPELKLHQCGLPKKMALILFEPFIIRKLKNLGFVHTVRGARKMIEQGSSEVWDILEEVTKGHPILLNRAPTLHRLSIQSFEPILIEGDAIRIHPLVCTAYNADFDGDQMAVHIPLSLEAIMECKLLMMATSNLFMLSSGKPVMTPSQDIVLGAYYLTCNPRENNKSKSKRIPLIENYLEVLYAETTGILSKHDYVYIINPDFNKNSIYGNRELKVIKTTVGRIIFNTLWPKELGYINEPITKNKLGDLILQSYNAIGKIKIILILDKMKEMCFKVATQAGISIAICDMIIPNDKKEIISIAKSKLSEIDIQYKRGIITTGERSNKIIDIWTNATDNIGKSVYKELKANNNKKELNPVFIMMDSGARGNKNQVRQLCGARGLMAKPSGSIIEKPILSSFREGLSVLEFFNSTHGARKGLADTALKTADAGYLTRKLCDVAMDCIIIDERNYNIKNNDKGIVKSAIFEGDDEIVSLYDRIVGRCSAETILNPLEKEKVLVFKEELITPKIAKNIVNSGIEAVKIISPLTHSTKYGLPAKAYGIDLSTREMVRPGTAVGIIAAQSIGEPGTQLTMRTFHIGGVANQRFKTPEIKGRHSGKVKFRGLRLVLTEEGNNIVINKTGKVLILDEDEKELEVHNIISGAILTVSDGEYIEVGDILAMWDPHNIPILSEKGGKVIFKDLIQGITLKKEIDELTGRATSVVMEHKEDLNPTIEIILNNEKVAYYSIPTGAQIVVNEDEEIAQGALLAKTPRSASKTQDITGGLPRVAELFEVRSPKEKAEISKISGIVSISGMIRGKKRLIIHNQVENKKEEHLIPHGKHIIVHEGDWVQKGQYLTEGSYDIQEILEILGPDAVQEYLLSEIQKVYRLQGENINDKHIEIIISRMLKKVLITDPGDSSFFWGEQIDNYLLEVENNKIILAGGNPAKGKPILLGITKASLETESFISAASFQETTKVLTDSAILGKQDYLYGFKENVILGHLIPAGTGLINYRRLIIENTQNKNIIK